MITFTKTVLDVIAIKNLSYDILEAIEKLIKTKKISTICISVDFSKNEISIISHYGLQIKDIQMLSENIPKLIEQIKLKDIEDNKKEQLFLNKWFKKYKEPKQPKREWLEPLYTEVIELYKYAQKMHKDNDVSSSVVCDIDDVTKYMKLLDAGKFKEAAKFRKSMDTYTRDYIPSVVREYLESTHVY